MKNERTARRKRKQVTSVKRLRRAVQYQQQSNWLQQALDRAAKQVASWPDWKRSIDVDYP